MGFSRSTLAKEPPSAQGLTEAMAGIGMGFAAQPDPMANIEDTLLFASMDAMDRDDLRVLAVLVTWFGVHHERVNADRLTHLVDGQSERVMALWSALARWQGKDRRFARLTNLYGGPRLDLLAAGSEFQLRRHGEDPRFESSPLRVSANVLRDRADDVSSPAEVARGHRAYRWRLMMGPSFRADCWAVLDADPHASAAEVARRSYASFATAWQVKRDFTTLAKSGVRRPAITGS